MLSKNNRKEQFRKQEPKKQRFAIKKLTVGVASVLIGFTFMGMNASADTTAEANSGAGSQPVAETQNSASNQANSQATLTTPNSQGTQSSDNQIISAAPASETAAQKYENAVSDAIDQATKAAAAKSGDASVTTPASSSTASASSADDQQTTSFNVKANAGSANEQKLASLYGTSFVQTQPVAAPAATTQKTLRGTQTQDVSDWQGFVNAMNDSSVGTINLTADITVADRGTNINGLKRPDPGLGGKVANSGELNLTGSNISGGLVIDGQNHAINFGTNYLSFTTNNQKDSNPWDIDFKNLTINANGYDNSYTTFGGAFSPFYMGGDDINTDLLAKNKVTFENVTADVKNGAFYTTTMAKLTTDDPYTTVTFKGNNNITCEAVNVKGNQLYNYSSAVMASHIIFADGTNTVFNVSSAKTNNDQNAGGNILRAKVEDEKNDTAPAIDVQQGATVTLNGKSTDVKGMLVNSAITGTVQVDGNLNANMADGHSMAIWAGNLNIGKTGNVNINTEQSNDGSGPNGVTNYNGAHFAPISLGVGFAANVTNADSNLLDNAGTLTVIRTGNNNTSTTPLISFGSGNGTGAIFTLNVHDGATLDLQDGANSSYKGTIDNTPHSGLITMWGSGNGTANYSDNITITNPKYVNLQRSGDKTGTLFRLEDQNNHVNVQSNGAGNPLPFAQWDEGNKQATPSHYWYLNNLTTQNNWGNNSITGFTAQGNAIGQSGEGQDKFLHSNGTVTFGGSQAGLNQYQYKDGTITQGQPNPGVTYQTPYLNNFLNDFSWWTPQRISMGTNLETKVTPSDAEKYQPVVQTIDGNTNQTLSDLTAKDGIKGLLSSDGTVTTDLSSVKNVSWYDAATDATEWKTVMGDEAEPTNPTGNLKTSDKSAWAKVTYTDGSVDFANIPLNITQPMAETYTPSYKPVTVEQGQTATDEPSFTDQDGKNVTVPTGTTFTTGTDTPNWANIDPSTGTVTVKPGTDVTPGAYNVPVTVTYPDKSTDETTVPVIVTKAGQTVTWGDNGAVVTTVDTSKLNAHETTANSQVLSAAGVVTAEGYELTDGKLSTTATPITIDPSTVSWTTRPDTNVDTATASGKEITTSVNVDFTNNDAAKNILGSKNGVVTTNPFTIDAKGAGAKAVTAPVDIKLGSDLTSEQFGQLVDNNIPNDEIAKTEWATKPNAQGQNGVIKITFTDNDANGNPTYLNINIPASSIKVTTDAEINTPQGQDVSTKVGEVPDAEKGIKNPGSLPSGTTYTWQDTPDTTKPGKKPAVVVVTYPDGSKDTVPTNVIVNANPEIKTITTTVGGDPAATEGIANLNNGGTTPVDGYPTSATWTTKPDTSKPGATTGTATVTYPDGTTETVTIPVAVNGGGDVVIIDNGHVFSLHANDVVTHKTSDKNIIGGPVIESFKLSYYEGGQNYSKPYIYTLNADKTAYVLTQTGDNPSSVTVKAPQSINASDIKINWTADGTVLFNNALGAIKGNGQPTSLASANNGGTKTITYTNWVNNQFGYPKYSAVVNTSNVIWPIYGKGPVSTYPFPSVYIYGAEANGTIPSVYSDTPDLKAALGDASKLVNTSDLTADHNAEISSVEWQTLPSLTEANAKAPATVRINFTDDSYLDVPVFVNVIKVDQGVNDKTNHDIYRDITRTINIQGESTPVIQHVIYSRAKITDLSKPAGQQISYTDWAAAKNSEGQVVTNFPQYEVTKPGYTATATGATIETVDGKQYVPASGTITETSQNETVNVTYTANEHTLVINYVDGNGTIVGTYNVPGKTDETVNVDVPGNVPTNWKLVPNQQTISSYKFGSDDPQPLDYKVEHGTENVPVDKNNKDTYRKITQTIQEVPAGKTNADMTVVRVASFEFERTGVKDLVTGEITWNAWNSNSETFPVYNIKEQKGYDSYVNGVNATEVAAVTVNPDSSNITDTITYVKQAATPVPYDPSNKDMNKSVTRTINYEVPAGHEAIAPVTQTVEYTRDVNGVAGYQDPVTGDITWNPWHVKSGKAEFASASVEQIKGYDSYVDDTKATEVPAAQVTEKDGVPQNGATVTVSYQKQADTVVPYKPGQEGVNDDMNQYVTRTIVVHEPGKDPVSHDQTVHFTREDAQGNAGYTDPVTGETTWNAWHVAGELNQANGTWAEFNAPTVKGYTPSQANVAAEEVTAETKDVTVDINYAPVAPTGQNVTTKVGEVPDADQGIANKGDLPDGTKYSWKTTPDVTTEGNKPAVVVVTYPGGSTVEVPVTVTVTKNPTDADKYTPEGQDVDTKTGIVPDPADGIKNKGDLPDGTKYTWKDTPDVSTEGNKPATVVVTYPDGSKDEVPVTIHVTNPATDADKYTPEGQDVDTKTGVVPDPADGIKNKGDLPDGTKYTWKDTPDVTTAGDKPATVVVTYPDGSKDEVPVTIHVTNPTTPTDADKYTPEGQDVNTKTGVVPDPADGIKNKGDLPDGTKYTWKDTPDVTTAGNKPATVVVTYPDGSKDEVPVTIHVTNPTTPTDADKYTPEGQDVNTKTGVVPDPADGIKNKGDLPDGTKYTWKDTPDVTTAGNKPATIVVTYPDGSKDEVPVTIHVTNPTTPTDADKYTPEGQDVNTKTGVVPDPADGIKNKGDLPDGTKYTWKDTPDVTTAGDKPATVVVTYPDGSKDEVPVTIHVTNPTTPTDADKYTPEGQDVNTKTGVVPDPADGIKNKGDLPDGTKYTWKDTPDVSTEGNKPATIVATYPDGSKDEVPVTIHVTNPATDADKYTPETQPITTPEGKVPDPADGIKNKADLPDGTKYTWTNPDQVAQDVKTPGSHTETITVRYPDGSEDTVTVTVNIPAPEGQNITTDQGKLPNPADAIKNKDQMPDGTTYTWKQEPDVSTPGDHTGVVEVHFPDGTTYEVTVDVHVDAVNPDNGGNMNSGNGSIDHQNGTEINNGNMTNANNGSVIENVTGQTQNSATNSTSQQPAKTLPQTGNDSSKFSALAGLSLAAFASLFGFASHDKKRKADK
ncbi:Rib/alpha-like domain-containing protein [Limosilactobacillus reuteri]|uniref:Rib/alpha-like domain-containing protein n=1 Tax=Limosilactobacillus reuteri TaxID=1598 RepID=UPI00254DBB18|nr:Rib/alpha-like domain-containing protein [Limosilactobacillus reuteri]MDK8117210.1 Rib/alpha-like domain-containing protein [Limosilactobacillus reuteri]